MTLGDIIKDYREKHGLSMAGFAERSGLSKAYISILEKNKTQRGSVPVPSIDAYRDVAKAINMDLDELVQIVDGKIKLENGTRENILLFTEPVPQIMSFPVVASVCAGYNGLAVEDYTDEREEIPVSMFKGYPSSEVRVLRVKGDSMYPRFMDGDKVLVHIQEDVDDGDVAVVLYNGDEATLKKVSHIPGGVELVPYNPEYQVKKITGAEAKQVRIFGKVLKLMRDV